MCTKNHRKGCVWGGVEPIMHTKSTPSPALDNSAHSPFKMEQDCAKLLSMKNNNNGKPGECELKPMSRFACYKTGLMQMHSSSCFFI